MEFRIIDSISRHTGAQRADVVRGMGDDAALLQPPPGHELAVAVDTMVEGVHFPPGTRPADIGWKALAVNLSDLAAMGATPAWAVAALTCPDGDADFMEQLATGLGELAARHDVTLVGGDTTQGPLSITVTVHGFVPAGQALLRSGAQAGDHVFVTGTLGDAAAALARLERMDEAARHLHARLNRPQPRLAAGEALRNLATAAIDISDGLLADLGHICRASGVGASVRETALPLSPALTQVCDAAAARDHALAGGDDYELCFTVPPDQVDHVAECLQATDDTATCIGRIGAGDRVEVLGADGKAHQSTHGGWEHFDT